MKIPFDFEICYAGLKDVGQKREENQDEVLLCPELRFFGVSDGMGGLSDGGRTSEMISRVLPDMLKQSLTEQTEPLTAERVSELLIESVTLISNSIYETGNQGRSTAFGATLSGAMLIGTKAVFVNIGDSRGYLLRRKDGVLSRVTRDHNVAAMLVESGDLTPEQAKHHATSSRITRFMGMPAPAQPETFIETIEPGDILLFCSDGLHGMLEEDALTSILTHHSDPEQVCLRLIDAANAAGGNDNISAVYVRVKKRGLFGVR